MLTQDGLVGLYRDLKDRKVLSIYIDGEGRDPAVRRAWRTRLEHRLSELRRKLDGPADGGGRGEMEAAARHLAAELDRFQTFLPDRGWVGFATPERSWLAGSVPAPMPDLVIWEPGIRAAPYVRALKQARPVVVALVDRRRARIFTYRGGALDETEELRSDRDTGDPDTSVPKRAPAWSGSGGATASDTVQRLTEVDATRLLKRVVERVAELAGSDGLVVVGGTAETGAQLMQQLPRGIRDRAVEVQTLHLDMADPEVKRHAEDAATELTRVLQERVVAEIVDLAGSGGRGVVGDAGTTRALLERRVDILALSRTFIREYPDRADHMVGTAFEQGGEVEELSGPGAERLDREGAGVGARLRW